jgi:hypothetical protein
MTPSEHRGIEIRHRNKLIRTNPELKTNRPEIFTDEYIEKRDAVLLKTILPI